MPLTPADVHNVVFSRPRIGKRGYSPEEVDLLLELVEDELIRHIEEQAELRKLNASHLNREAALQKKIAEVRQWEAKLGQWENDLREQESELQQRDAQFRQHEVALQQKATELHKFDVARNQKIAALRQMEAKLRQQEAKLRQQQAALQDAVELRQHDAALAHPEPVYNHPEPTYNNEPTFHQQEATFHQQAATFHAPEAPVRYTDAAIRPQVDQHTTVGENGQIKTWRTVAEVHGKHAMEWTAVRAVADLLGSAQTTETKQEWVRKSEPEQNVTSIETAQVKQLQKENAELNKVNEILRAAAALFAAEIQRPGVAVEDILAQRGIASP